MSKYIRYTCNKKNEPIFEEDCKQCSEYKPCAKEGQWCYVGALVAEAKNNEVRAEVSMPTTENLAAPVMRDTSTVKIHIGNGQTMDVLREDIAKALERDFYKNLHQGMFGGTQ